MESQMTYCSPQKQQYCNILPKPQSWMGTTKNEQWETNIRLLVTAHTA